MSLSNSRRQPRSRMPRSLQQMRRQPPLRWLALGAAAHLFRASCKGGRGIAFLPAYWHAVEPNRRTKAISAATVAGAADTALWLRSRSSISTPRPVVAEPRVWRAAAGSASLPSGGDEQDPPDLGRRVALGAVVAVGSVAAIKKFGVDGNMDEFDPAPGSMAGRTVVITGGNTGLGRESAIRLARAGASVVFTARTDEKGQEAEEAIRRASGSRDVRYLQLDLGSLDSVRSFRDRLETLGYGDRIDVLMNNAGVMAIPERKETRDGFEQQFGVNHLGHFALVGVLLPLLRRARDGAARVINISSTASLGGTADLVRSGPLSPAEYSPWGAYCQSKLANVLFAKELDRRFKANGMKATAVSCHPGGVDTDLQRWVISSTDNPKAAKQSLKESPVGQAAYNFFTRTVQLGANTQIFLATAADAGLEGGGYYDNMRPGLINPAGNDEGLARWLWDESERLTGVKIDL